MNCGVCVVDSCKNGALYRLLRVGIGKGGMIDIENRNMATHTVTVSAKTRGNDGSSDGGGGGGGGGGGSGINVEVPEYQGCSWCLFVWIGRSRNFHFGDTSIINPPPRISLCFSWNRDLQRVLGMPLRTTII